ncbi:MAG: metalloregulator ArsR/SmtB family transcription factor [Pseudomonadota bacterium]
MEKLDSPVLDHTQATECFAALGSEQRLGVLLALVAAGPAGMNAGDLAMRTGIGASTLTHHLRFLSQSGLVRQERQGRQIRSFAQFERVEQLSQYLMLNCCSEPEGSDT